MSAIPERELLLLAAAVFLFYSAARAALLRALTVENAHRVAASAGSVCVVAACALAGNAHGCAALLGYMAADVSSALLFGPALPPLMLAHHAATCFLTASGLAYMLRPAAATAAMVDTVAGALLWMEASNPFLHACTVVTSEPALARAQRFVLPVAAPGLVFAYAYFRVVRVPLCLPLIWPHRAALGPLAGAYLAVVAALSLLQWFWFYKICAKIGRDTGLLPQRGAKKQPQHAQ
jgi:hypothetical protein